MIYSKNGACWCGSKKKYKHCHYEFDQKLIQMKMQGYEVPPKSIIRNQKDIQILRESAKINTAVLDAVAKKFVKE